MLLREAGLDIHSLQVTLKRLVDEARPFAAVDKRARATVRTVAPFDHYHHIYGPLP